MDSMLLPVVQNEVSNEVKVNWCLGAADKLREPPRGHRDEHKKDFQPGCAAQVSQNSRKFGGLTWDAPGSPLRGLHQWRDGLRVLCCDGKQRRIRYESSCPLQVSSQYSVQCCDRCPSVEHLVTKLCRRKKKATAADLRPVHRVIFQRTLKGVLRKMRMASLQSALFSYLI